MVRNCYFLVFDLLIQTSRTLSSHNLSVFLRQNLRHDVYCNVLGLAWIFDRLSTIVVGAWLRLIIRFLYRLDQIPTAARVPRRLTSRLLLLFVGLSGRTVHIFRNVQSNLLQPYCRLLFGSLCRKSVHFLYLDLKRTVSRTLHHFFLRQNAFLGFLN